MFAVIYQGYLKFGRSEIRQSLHFGQCDTRKNAKADNPQQFV
jgi:hypothetical protein